jgi:hypothetical protein
MLMRVCFAFALLTGVPVVWAQPASSDSPPADEPAKPPPPPQKLQIGSVAGLPRPEGFVVQDLRSLEMRTATPLKQTYKAPMQMPFQRQPVPLAKYERVIGDEELSVSPVELLAEKLVERYGDKLAGKRLVVHEFSYQLEHVVNKPQGMTYTVVPGGGVGLAAALAMSVIGSAAGTAMLQGKGIDVKLNVKLDAELDGKRVEARELPMALSGEDAPARVTRYAVEKFIWLLEMPAAEPEKKEPAEPVKKE